jgi:predicted NAD/FAD-dependent oxidoreductase
MPREADRPSALVIGAGIAGLAAATELARHGHAVTLVDKGRKPGGRVASRMRDGIAFNHGAQFVTAHGSAWAQTVAAAGGQLWLAAGGDGRRLAVSPAMAALPAKMAAEAVSAGVELHVGQQIVHLDRRPDGWIARMIDADKTRPGVLEATAGTATGPFDTVIVAIPSVQAAPMLERAGASFADRVAGAELAPCWAVAVRFRHPLPLPDVVIDASPAIGWSARETARPGLAVDGDGGPSEAWMLHASPAWTREHLEMTANEAGSAVLSAFARATGASGGEIVFAHRWRYARVTQPIGTQHLWDADRRLGACGDWCIGPRVEAAFESGRSLGQRIATEAN